jgi:hypothetical protein
MIRLVIAFLVVSSLDASPRTGQYQQPVRTFRHLFHNQFIHIHTYHSRFIPEGVAEASQIFLRDTHVLPKLVSYEEH